MGVLHAPDEDGVVALEVRAHRDALELHQRLVDERQAQRAHAERYPVELVEPGRGEPPRHHLLVAAQDVDGEPPALEERGIALRLVVHADQHEGWIEGHRAERARRETGGTPVAVAGRDDGDASGEVAERAPERVRGNHHPCVAGRSPKCKISRIDKREFGPML